MSFGDFLPHNLHYRVTVLVVSHPVSRIVLSDFVLNASCFNSDIGWAARCSSRLCAETIPSFFIIDVLRFCSVSSSVPLFVRPPFLKLEIRSAKYDIPLGRCATAKTQQQHRCCIMHVSVIYTNRKWGRTSGKPQHCVSSHSNSSEPFSERKSIDSFSLEQDQKFTFSHL